MVYFIVALHINTPLLAAFCCTSIATFRQVLKQKLRFSSNVHQARPGTGAQHSVPGSENQLRAKYKINLINILLLHIALPGLVFSKNKFFSLQKQWQRTTLNSF